MKKIIGLILALLVVFTAVAVSLISCDSKSQHAKLGLKAMDAGEYERARRLYNFAVEKGEADEEDKRIYDILCAYIDAKRSLKSEDFSEGLDILDGCIYDYSTLSISDDMDRLYGQLSDGKYADERIKALGGVLNAKNYDKAKTMIEEINKLSLTSAQQEKLYALSRSMTDAISAQQPSDAIIYYVNKPKNSSVALYYEASEDSDEICRIPGGEAVEVQAFAENGFIQVVYGADTGYVKSSVIAPEKTDGNEKDDEDDSDEDGEAPSDDDDNDDDDDSNTKVEAISANDKLFVITGVNLRPEPTTECDVIDTIPAGSEVTYLGEMEHGFYKIEYNGTVGYAYSDYLQK